MGISVTPTPPDEAFNDYIAIVASCIDTNMGTSDALANASNNSNTSLVSLTQDWTTNSNNTPVGFSQGIPIYDNPVAAALYGGFYYDGSTPYQNGDAFLTPSQTPTSTQFYGLDPNSAGVPQGFVANPYLPGNIPPSNSNPYGWSAPQQIETFISTYLTGSSGYLTDLSSTMVLSIIGALQANWDSSGSQSSTSLALCNQAETLVSAAGTNNEQSLQTICSTLTNLLGQSQNALQTIVSGGSSVTQMVSSLVNAMSYY